MTSTARALPPPGALRVDPPAEGVDLAGAEQAAAAFLTALGTGSAATGGRHG